MTIWFLSSIKVIWLWESKAGYTKLFSYISSNLIFTKKLLNNSANILSDKNSKLRYLHFISPLWLRTSLHILNKERNINKALISFILISNKDSNLIVKLLFFEVDRNIRSFSWTLTVLSANITCLNVEWSTFRLSCAPWSVLFRSSLLIVFFAFLVIKWIYCAVRVSSQLKWRRWLVFVRFMFCELED